MTHFIVKRTFANRRNHVKEHHRSHRAVTRNHGCRWNFDFPDPQSQDNLLQLLVLPIDLRSRQLLLRRSLLQVRDQLSGQGFGPDLAWRCT